MSKNILIGTYVFTVQSKEEKDNTFYSLNELVESQDFFDIFVNFCNKRRKDKFKTRHKRLEVSKFEKNRKEKEIYGIFRGGAIGENFDVDDEQEDALLLSVEDKHCVYRDFFFYFIISEDEKEGFLLIQKVGRREIQQLIRMAILEFVQATKSENKKLVLNKRLPTITMEQMLDEGLLKTIEFTKKTIPTSWGGLIEKKQNTTYEKGTLKHIIKSRTKEGLGTTFKNKVKNIWKSKTSNKTTIDIEDFGGEYNEVTCEVIHNHKKVKLYLINTTGQSAYIDITKDVTIDKDGKPNFYSLVDESRKIVDNIMELQP